MLNIYRPNSILNVSKAVPTKVLQPGNGRKWAIGQGISFWRDNTFTWLLFTPRVLPSWTPRPPGSNPNPPQAVADLLREANRPQTPAQIDKRLDLVDHLEESDKDIP